MSAETEISFTADEDAHIRTLGISVLVVYATGIVVMEMSGVLKPFILALFFSVLLSPVVDYLTMKRTCECNRKCVADKEKIACREKCTMCGTGPLHLTDEEKRALSCGQRTCRLFQEIWGSWVDLFTTCRFPFWLALLVAISLVFLLIFMIFLIIWSAVATLIDNQEIYEEQFYLLINSTAEWITSAGYEISDQEIIDEFEDFDWEHVAEEVFAIFTESVAFFCEILLFLVYILLSRNPKADYDLKTGEIREEAVTTASTVKEGIKKYLMTKSLIATLNGLLAGFLLAAFSVPLAPTFGLLTIFMDFIPNVGSIIATLLPLPILFFDPSIGTTNAIIVFLLMTTMQMLVGEIIEPMVVGHQMNVHPLTVLLALVFFNFVWGISGMILSIPIVICFKIIVESSTYDDRLKAKIIYFIENNMFDAPEEEEEEEETAAPVKKNKEKEEEKNADAIQMEEVNKPAVNSAPEAPQASKT